MAVIHIHRTLESDTLHLPELKPLIGHAVEIIVRDEGSVSPIPSQKPNWDAALKATWKLEDYDYQAQIDQDACDMRDAEERLR